MIKTGTKAGTEAGTEPHYLEVGEGEGRRRIAYLTRPGRDPAVPGLVWLPGFRSQMIGTKAVALDDWCAGRGIALTRFDYSGHGRSEGVFEEGTIGAWLEETLAILRYVARGPQILVGSSMGGWLALLALRRLAGPQYSRVECRHVKGAVLIAPAFDMTEALMWKKFPEDIRREIETRGAWHRPSDYGDGPYPITRRLIEEGRAHLLDGASFDPGCPVRILQGLKDPDVPWRRTLALVDLLASEDVQLTLVKDAEHRLSRPRDLALLLRTIASLLDADTAAST